MNLVTVDCNSCGAPLEVGLKTRFVTCRYCSKRLAVEHSDSSVYTEVLDEIKDSTDKISQDMEVLKLQNELERMDREWLLERERFMVTSKDGGRRLPTAMGGVVGGAIGAFFGVMWVGFAASMGAPSFFLLFGVGFIVVSVVSGFKSVTSSSDYQQAEKRYQVHRSRLQQQITVKQQR